MPHTVELSQLVSKLPSKPVVDPAGRSPVPKQQIFELQNGAVVEHSDEAAHAAPNGLFPPDAALLAGGRVKPTMTGIIAAVEIPTRRISSRRETLLIKSTGISSISKFSLLNSESASSISSSVYWSRIFKLSRLVFPSHALQMFASVSFKQTARFVI